MKDYELDVDYSTSIRVELPDGVDIESINREIKQLDEFLQDPQSEFEGIIKEMVESCFTKLGMENPPK